MNEEYIVEVTEEMECITVGRLIRCGICKRWKREDKTGKDALGIEWHYCPVLKTETGKYDYCSSGREHG